MRVQSIRPSQYITTYGPGSILEGPEGPRIVLALEHSRVFGQDSPVSYAIADAGLSQLLPDGAGIIRIPSNAERQVRDSEPIYETDPFPRWSLCVKHNILYRYQQQNVIGCPACGPHEHWSEASRRSRREAIRFVMACSAGHLDDVNWPEIIQHHNVDCKPQTLRWEGGGGALRNIVIVCPDCGAKANLGIAYGKNWHCSGRYPERRGLRQPCQREARITQRGAANLHITELVTGVTIPKLDTTLHQALGSREVVAALDAIHDTVGLTSGAQIRSALQKLAERRRLPAMIITEINKYTDDLILVVAQDVLSMQLPQTLEEARLKEFTELQRAATRGHPAQPSATPGAPPLFEVIPHQVKPAVPGPGGCQFRVTPVSRLRVVMVQLGYRRLDGGENDLVSSMYIEGQNRWLPGVELFGEGIFIDLTPAPGHEAATAHLPMAGDDVDQWMADWKRGQGLYKHPVFVWWHTLAHRLILALAIDSGYSSSAIRERVYVRVNPSTRTATGGVLLYTAQPGGDGTLGGLIALVPRFDRVLQAALRDVDACSNDPLCNEEHYGFGRINGAACYACSFVSETSCEFRNMYLDRNILRLHQP